MVREGGKTPGVPSQLACDKKVTARWLKHITKEGGGTGTTGHAGPAVRIRREAAWTGVTEISRGRAGPIGKQRPNDESGELLANEKSRPTLRGHETMRLCLIPDVQYRSYPVL